MNIRAQIYGYTPSPRSPLVQVKKPKGAKADMLHSITVIRREARSGDTRAEERHEPQAHSGRVRHNGAVHDIQLMNRCSGGAMIAAELEAAPWDRVQLDVGDEQAIDCVVLWMKDPFVGLQFAAH